MVPNWPPDHQNHTGQFTTSEPSTPDLQGSPILNSQATSSNPGPQLVAPQSNKPPSSLAIWIDRLGLVIRVVFYIELGMLLAVLPWTRLWTENGLVLGMPQLRSVLQMNFVRGVVTGVGLVDMWIGIWEAVRYREVRTH